MLTRILDETFDFFKKIKELYDIGKSSGSMVPIEIKAAPNA